MARSKCRENRQKLLKSRELNVVKIWKSKYCENSESRTTVRETNQSKMHLVYQKSCNFVPQLGIIPTHM